jgi:hypothetical protein
MKSKEEEESDWRRFFFRKGVLLYEVHPEKSLFFTHFTHFYLFRPFFHKISFLPMSMALTIMYVYGPR